MPSDEQLAHEVQKGEVAALDELVERHHSSLIGFLYRMTGGERSLAEDLAQEAFIRVIKAIQTYQYPRPFKHWLYAIAINLVRDHYRKIDLGYSISSLTNHWEDEGLQVASPSTEELVQNEEEKSNLLAALKALPIQQREVFVLRYYQELPLADIAALLTIPVGTVKSRLSLGLQRLRETMEEFQHQ